MDGSGGRYNGDRSARGWRIEDIRMIPQDIATLRYVNASSRAAGRFAELEYGGSDRAWALAGLGRKAPARPRTGRLRLYALLAYFSPRYAFHGPQ